MRHRRTAAAGCLLGALAAGVQAQAAALPEPPDSIRAEQPAPAQESGEPEFPEEWLARALALPPQEDVPGGQQPFPEYREGTTPAPAPLAASCTAAGQDAPVPPEFAAQYGRLYRSREFWRTAALCGASALAAAALTGAFALRVCR